MAPLLLVIASPLLSAIFIMVFSASLSRALIKFLGFLGVLCSFLASLFLVSHYLVTHQQNYFLWSVLPVDTLAINGINIAFLVDPLSIVMILVVTFVSMLITLYGTEYMSKEHGLARFFVSINFFVFFMLLLVLGDNFFLLFIGWEGVGVCSYLLIGFYTKEKMAGLAAMKAFLTTRIGDVFLLFAVIFLATFLKTINLSEINELAHTLLAWSPLLTTVIALCLLGGAVGKSAQAPLQVWLPDAMWGPTPVSALIHAATMVTAGVYLLARMTPLIALSQTMLTLTFATGALTLIMGGVAALVQTDLKRVLAYSTMSQIGYMFLAIGVKAPMAAVFHVTTHAFFKALLFLAAGVIGHSLQSYDMRKMGGLYKSMPLITSLFLIGAINLVGLPVISAGFFSKEWILSSALIDPNVGLLAYSLGVLGVLLTGLYTTRMIMVVFFGTAKKTASTHHGFFITLPLIVLAAFSLSIGWLESPAIIFPSQWFSHWLSPVLSTTIHPASSDIWYFILPIICSIFSIVVGYFLWRHKQPQQHDTWLITILKDGGGFNMLYNAIIIKPYIRLAYFMQKDAILTVILFVKAHASHALEVGGRMHLKPVSYLISWFIIAALAMMSAMVMS